MKKLLALTVLSLSLVSCGHFRHGGCGDEQCKMNKEKCASCCEKKGEQCPMTKDAPAATTETKK
jgi:hypothetical protein